MEEVSSVSEDGKSNLASVVEYQSSTQSANVLLMCASSPESNLNIDLCVFRCCIRVHIYIVHVRSALFYTTHRATSVSFNSYCSS